MPEKVDLETVKSLVNALGKISENHDRDIFEALNRFNKNRGWFVMSDETANLIQETLKIFTEVTETSLG